MTNVVMLEVVNDRYAGIMIRLRYYLEIAASSFPLFR